MQCVAVPRQKGCTDNYRTMTQRILLCDDDIHILRAAEFKLQRAGYAVDSAGDGLEGWESIQKARPDLVITDCQMPRLDGIGLVQRIRENPATADIPVLMLTAKAFELSHEEAVQMGSSGSDPQAVQPEGIVAACERNLATGDLRIGSNDHKVGSYPVPSGTHFEIDGKHNRGNVIGLTSDGRSLWADVKPIGKAAPRIAASPSSPTVQNPRDSWRIQSSLKGGDSLTQVLIRGRARRARFRIKRCSEDLGLRSDLAGAKIRACSFARIIVARTASDTPTGPWWSRIAPSAVRGSASWPIWDNSTKRSVWACRRRPTPRPAPAETSLRRCASAMGGSRCQTRAGGEPSRLRRPLAGFGIDRAPWG